MSGNLKNAALVIGYLFVLGMGVGLPFLACAWLGKMMGLWP